MHAAETTHIRLFPIRVKIAAFAFGGCKKPVLYVIKDSYADKYEKKNKISFVAKD